jgi:hypothetical protein
MTCRMPGAWPRILVSITALALPALAGAEPPTGRSAGAMILNEPAALPALSAELGNHPLMQFERHQGAVDATSTNPALSPPPIWAAFGLKFSSPPPSLRPARVPVPALYRLGVAARQTLAGSLLFAIHPLLALAPTADFLDAPSDHPQPVAGEDVLESARRFDEKLSRYCCTFNPGYPLPSWSDWLVNHFIKSHISLEPEPEVELAQFRVEEDPAESSQPATEQLHGMPKEDKPTEAEFTCPYLRQQAADRHVRLMADPQITQNVLENLQKLEEADRLFEVAGELMRQGHIGEAMTCYDVIRHLVPGSRFEAQVDEALAEFGVPAKASEGQDHSPQTKKDASWLEKLVGFLQVAGVPMPPLVNGSPADPTAGNRPLREDCEAYRQVECEWEGKWYGEEASTPVGVEASSIPPAESAKEDDEIQKRLRRPVSIHLNDMPLKTVLKDLRAFHGIKIRLDRKALEDEGIDLHQPVTVFLEDITLRSALHLMLHPLNLTFVVKEDAVWITPRTKTKKNQPGLYNLGFADDCGKKESPRQREREIERKLKTPVTLDFTDAPLKSILADIRAWKDLNIYVDEAALAEHGISLDRPVTIKVDQVSLKGALRLLLQCKHLTYVIKDEVLVITTEDRARGKEVVSTYNVSDLVVKKPRTICSAAAGEEETLMRLITSTIAPRTWAAKGGTGTVDYFPLTHSLVIRQTPEVQEQVADLLAALRRQRDYEEAGLAEQVAGLLKACRLSAEAGDTVHAADLAREAFALDPERVAADPLVYKMHLLTAAQKPGAGSARQCESPPGTECLACPDAIEVLPPPAAEEEENTTTPPPEGHGLLDVLLGPHGHGELGLDSGDGSVRMTCEVHCGDKVFHVRLRHGRLGLWTTPDTSDTPEGEGPR